MLPKTSPCGTKRAAENPLTRKDTPKSSPGDINPGDPFSEQAMPKELFIRVLSHTVGPRAFALPSPEKTVLHEAQPLCRLSQVNRGLNQSPALQALRHMARWSLALSRLWSLCAQPEDIDLLLRNPLSALHKAGVTPTPEILRNGATLVALLLDFNHWCEEACANEVRRKQAAVPLLVAMYKAWYAQSQWPHGPSSPGAPALALGDLPQRLIRSGAGLTPDEFYDVLPWKRGRSARVGSPTVQCLMLCLAHVEPTLRNAIWLELVLLFEVADKTVQKRWKACVRQHHVDRIEAACDINDGLDLLLYNPDAMDLDDAEALLNTLIDMPLRSGMAWLTMVSRLMSIPRFKALIRGELWVDLVASVLVEIDHSPPNMKSDGMRIHYLMAIVPPEIGVAAFQRLPPERRIRHLRLPLEAHRLLSAHGRPYVQALLNAPDVARAQALAVLDEQIELAREAGEAELASGLESLRPPQSPN